MARYRTGFAWEKSVFEALAIEATLREEDGRWLVDVLISMATRPSPTCLHYSNRAVQAPAGDANAAQSAADGAITKVVSGYMRTVLGRRPGSIELPAHSWTTVTG